MCYMLGGRAENVRVWGSGRTEGSERKEAMGLNGFGRG